jgi:hypothetical protein
MPTQKQIEANRLNALHSTGPRTPEGKRASSQNALKSGLDADSQFVLGESREDFALLQAEHYSHFAPRTPEARFQVDKLIRSEWFLRRFFRVEAHLWEYHTMQAERGTGVELGEAFSNASPIFMRLQRRITAAEKAHQEAVAELQRLRRLSQPQETKAETPELASFLPGGESFALPAERSPAGPAPTAPQGKSAG